MTPGMVDCGKGRTPEGRPSGAGCERRTVIAEDPAC